MKGICILLLFVNICFGQQNKKTTSVIENCKFRSDSTVISPNSDFNKYIEIKDVDKSSATVDIRLYEHYSLSNTSKLRRIFLEKGKWRAIEFNEWNNPQGIHKSDLVPKNSLDTLFSKLLSYHFLTLPNQTELKDKMHLPLELENGEMVEPTLRVMDGTSYTVEIKIGNQFRIYQFSNPGIYAESYVNVSELKDFEAIVETFKNDLVISNIR